MPTKSGVFCSNFYFLIFPFYFFQPCIPHIFFF
jgi:hypothetical protein